MPKNETTDEDKPGADVARSEAEALWRGEMQAEAQRSAEQAKLGAQLRSGQIEALPKTAPPGAQQLLNQDVANATHNLLRGVNDLSELDGRELFLVALPERFAAYVVQRAHAHNMPPERMLEGMVRKFWQHDDWRTAQTSTAPTQIGEPAGTVRKR